MSEILSSQPIQPITPFRNDDAGRLVTINYYKSVLPQIERIIMTNAECKNLGPEIFSEYQTSDSIEKNKKAIELCGDCAVKELCKNWATAERLEGVIAGGEKTKAREKARRFLNVSIETRDGEVEGAKVALVRHAIKNRAVYLGMLSAHDRDNSFF